MSDGAAFAADLLAWYDRAAADLPWRRAPEPYRIWLSEIMLQQTQVETAIPYYERFLEALPSVEALAAAPLAAVLKLWEGLGYYSRARSLHRAAKIIVSDLGGHFPTTADGLRQLPGVGPYTAGAVASIAFGQRAPALDGNVMRVFARLTDLTADISLPQTRADLWALAARWLPPERPGDYNQALMELGRTVCRPRAPLCDACPLRPHCRACAAGTQASRPVKTRRAPSPHHDVTAGLIWNDNNKLLIAQRPLDGLLGGLWEFPGGKREPGESFEQCLARELQEELGVTARVGRLVHDVTHDYPERTVRLCFFECDLLDGEPRAIDCQDCRWVRAGELQSYRFPPADDELIRSLSK